MGTPDVGARLRSSRQAHRLSIEDLAQRTRVQPRIIEAIERNDLAHIPPKPYGRGFIRAYAQEVGLDPDAAVREYFGQFPPAEPALVPAPEPDPWPRQWSWILPASALLVAALVLAAIAQGGRPPAPGAADVPEPVGTAGRGEGAGAIPERTPAPGRVDPVPAARDEAGLSVMLVADRVCWVAATADGTRVLYELLEPGARHTIEADREVTVRAGDAGALRLGVNGGQPEIFGRDGQVRTARFTPAGAPPVPGARQPISTSSPPPRAGESGSPRRTPSSDRY